MTGLVTTKTKASKSITFPSEKAVFKFESLVEILQCDHSNESYRAEYFHYAVQGGSVPRMKS